MVKQYNEALNKALAQPDVQQRIAAVGAAATPGTPDDVDQRIRDDAAMWRRVVEDNDIRPE